MGTSGGGFFIPLKAAITAVVMIVSTIMDCRAVFFKKGFIAGREEPGRKGWGWRKRLGWRVVEGEPHRCRRNRAPSRIFPAPPSVGTVRGCGTHLSEMEENIVRAPSPVVAIILSHIFTKCRFLKHHRYRDRVTWKIGYRSRAAISMLSEGLPETS